MTADHTERNLEVFGAVRIRVGKGDQRKERAKETGKEKSFLVSWWCWSLPLRDVSNSCTDKEQWRVIQLAMYYYISGTVRTGKSSSGHSGAFDCIFLLIIPELTTWFPQPFIFLCVFSKCHLEEWFGLHICTLHTSDICSWINFNISC